jgi:hypothetical protein
MKLLHIGYYNDIDDLKMMTNSPADEIIFNYKVGKGHFYKVEPELYDESELAHLNPQLTFDKDFAIVYDVPTDDNILNIMTNDDYCDFFIDIYKVVEESEMVHIDKVCELLEKYNEICCGELSMIFGNNFIENFKKELVDYGKQQS